MSKPYQSGDIECPAVQPDVCEWEEVTEMHCFITGCGWTHNRITRHRKTDCPYCSKPIKEIDTP